MKSHAITLLVALTLVATPLAAVAQPAERVLRVGVLASGTTSSMATSLDAFRQGMRQLGYVEGRNTTIEYRWAEGRFNQLPALVAELVHLKVDVIVTTFGTPPALAAKNATKAIPIVFVGVGDPVGSGVVASLPKPGGNITGLSLFVDMGGIFGKRLQLLKEAVPKVARVAVLWNPANAAEALAFAQMQAPARALGVTLQSLDVREPKDFASAFAAMSRNRPDALLVFEGPMYQAYRTNIVALAGTHKIPAIYGFREFAEAGGLIAYGASLPDLCRRAAIYVDKILRGAKPADLPVEQATKFDLVINLKTAKTLGLKIPPSVLAQADDVIQ